MDLINGTSYNMIFTKYEAYLESMYVNNGLQNKTSLRGYDVTNDILITFN